MDVDVGDADVDELEPRRRVVVVGLTRLTAFLLFATFDDNAVFGAASGAARKAAVTTRTTTPAVLTTTELLNAPHLLLWNCQPKPPTRFRPEGAKSTCAIHPVSLVRFEAPSVGQPTDFPYISPSGSLISSRRAPSGSLKYIDEWSITTYFTPSRSRLLFTFSHRSRSIEIAR